MSQLMRLLSLSSRLSSSRLHKAIPTTGPIIPPPLLRLFSTEASTTRRARTPIGDNFGLDRGTRTPLQDILRTLNDQVQRTGRVYGRTVEDAIARAEGRGFVSAVETQVLLRATGAFIKDMPASERQKLAAKVWKLTPKANLDISHYNTLLHINLENGLEFDPSDFLQQLSEAGVAPNRVTYQRLVQRYCQMGDIPNAKKIIEFMKAENLPVNDRVFHSLIIGHLKAGDPEGARSIPKVMESTVMRPTSETYTVLAEGLIEAGDTQGALDVIADQDLLDEQILRIAKALALKDDFNAVEKMLSMLSNSTITHNDVNNICIELLVARKPEAATLFFKQARVKTLRRSTGNLLVVQAAKCGCSLSDVLRLCEELKDETDENVFIEAARGAITTGNKALAKEYLEKLPEMGFPIRAHYYLPFLCAAPDEKAVLEELKNMSAIETPSHELLVDFVFPRVDCTDPNSLVDKLVAANVDRHTAANAVCYLMVKEWRLAECEKLLKTHEVTRIGSLPSLLGARASVDDLPATLRIIELLSKRAQEMAIGDENVVGQFLEKTDQSRRSAVDYISRTDLQLSRASFDRLLKRSPFVESLRKNVVDMPQFEDGENLVSERRVQELEELLQRGEDAGRDVAYLLKRLLVLYCREGLGEKVEETLKKLPVETLQGSILSPVVQFFVDQGDADRAMNFLYQAQERNIILNPYRTINTAELLVKQMRIEEAIEVLDKFLPAALSTGTEYTIESCAGHLLAAVDKQYGFEKCLEVFENHLKAHVDTRVLGRVIRNAAEEDLPRGLELFKEMSQRYNATPNRRFICKKLIMEDRTEELETIMNIMRSILPASVFHGDMLLCYLDCEKMEEAREMLFQCRGRHGRGILIKTCNNYLNDGMTRKLEALVKLMEDCKIERELALLFRFKLLSRENDVEAAMDLWTQAQEENVMLLPATLQTLADLLKRNERDVPFVVPDTQRVLGDVIFSPSTRFLDILNESVDQALEHRENLKAEGKRLESIEIQALIHELLNVNRLKEAFDVLGDLEDLAIFQNKHKVVLKRLLAAAAQNGMIAELEALSDLSEGRIGSAAIQRAYFSQGRLEEFVTKLENKPLDRVYFYLAPEFFVIGSPLAARFEKLAHRLATEKNKMSPIAQLWYLYIAKSEIEKAAELTEKYPDLINFLEKARISTAVTKEFDLAYFNRVIQITKSPFVLRKVCLCATVELISNNRYHEANKCIDRALELGFELSQFPARVLTDLGREVPGAESPSRTEAYNQEERARSA